MVDRLEQRYTGQITFYTYPEADKHQDAGDFASKQGVRAVPTTVLVSDEGAEITRWVGLTSEDKIVDQIEDALSSD